MANNVTVTPVLQTEPLVAEGSRTISGRVLPWDEFGRTNQGAIRFPKGSISIPTDLASVKLLAGHSPTGVAVGHATSFDSREDGLYMTFQLGSHEAADDALMQAAEHTVDAFSIEAHSIEADGTTVQRSILNAVALVPLPAFASARVQAVHAEADTDDDVKAVEPDEQDESPDDSPDEPAEADTPPTPDTEKDTRDMPKTSLTPGTLPGTPATTAEPIHASLDTMLDYFTAVANNRDADGIIAELTDITDAGMVGRTAPQWLGELWSGVVYERRIIPLITNAPLTSRKAVGYRWTTKPKVAKYEGNKADIPSFPAAIEAVEREAQRWAGGNDLDRAFWDFGETEFLNAYWRAMAESYAYETDADTAAFLADNALAFDAGATTAFEAIARGAILIDNTLHTPATFAIINPADLDSVLAVSALDAPKYLDLAGSIANPATWTTSDLVDRGTAIVGTKTAATFYELAGSPLRVEAEHIAKGGRDAALFGYTAHMVNRPEGLIKVKFADSAAPIEPAA